MTIWVGTSLASRLLPAMLGANIADEPTRNSKEFIDEVQAVCRTPVFPSWIAEGKKQLHRSNGSCDWERKFSELTSVASSCCASDRFSKCIAMLLGLMPDFCPLALVHKP